MVAPVYAAGHGKVRKRRSKILFLRAIRALALGTVPPVRAREESGQALILALGGALALIAAALALVAIAGAVTGKGRAQRAADLVAISAGRSMRDDLPRLLSPPQLANGQPNPNHLDKGAYLARAKAAALAAARANGIGADRAQVQFPDAGSFAPVRAAATIVAGLREGEGQRVEASAVAEAAAPYGAAAGGGAGMAAGGGYSGPLVYRDGELLRKLFSAPAPRSRPGSIDSSRRLSA